MYDYRESYGRILKNVENDYVCDSVIQNMDNMNSN